MYAKTFYYDINLNFSQYIKNLPRKCLVYFPGKNDFVKVLKASKQVSQVALKTV
jgi:hypothetical protein